MVVPSTCFTLITNTRQEMQSVVRVLDPRPVYGWNPAGPDAPPAAAATTQLQLLLRGPSLGGGGWRAWANRLPDLMNRWWNVCCAGSWCKHGFLLQSVRELRIMNHSSSSHLLSCMNLGRRGSVTPMWGIKRQVRTHSDLCELQDNKMHEPFLY